jgi:hypothetical protein
VDESSFESDSAGQSDSNSDDGKLMSVDCGEDDYQDDDYQPRQPRGNK